MSWQMAVVGAIGAAQYQHQGAIGKYNQAVANRNAVVAEQEAALIEKQSEFDIARFDKNFRKIESANFARIQGNIARQSARLAQIGTLASTGTSLLAMSNFSSGSPQSSTYSQANYSFARSR